MGSAFFGLNIGQQGLYTAQTNLNITSHNIANAETEGYSRQYGVQRATSPLSNSTRGMIGTGSEITTVLQHRDEYLDDKYRSMINELGEFEIKDELLSQMELVFNEPSDTGYSAFFNDMFESFQTLSKNPGDSTTRAALVSSMESFASYMNDMGAQLMDIQKDANFGINMSVKEINFNAQQLATLNNQIANLELTGSVANDLRDERNNLIDDLAKLINIDVRAITDINGQETYRVSINGQILVNDGSANYLETRPRETLDNPVDGVDMYDIYWENGKELQLDGGDLSGELKGYIDLRDGNNGENFTGTILSGQASSTLVYGNPSRTDLPQTGELYVDGTRMRYNSYTYDATADEITFEFGAPASVNGTTGSTTDIYGADFSGSITWNSAEQVVLTNTSNQDLEPTGTLNLDGTIVTYTGYSKNPSAPYEITFNIEASNTADGTGSYMGEDLDYKGVPYYMDQLNEFVRTIAREFNAINESGDGGTGTQLFAYDGYSGTPALDADADDTYEAINIHNFEVNEAVTDDVSLIETSAAANAGDGANDLILDLINLRHDDDMFDKGEPDNFMAAVIGELGIDTKQVQSLMSGQEDLVMLINNQRLSVSSVDMNEETTNLLKFQLAYEMSAQIISVMNEIYNVTINSMGV